MNQRIFTFNEVMAVVVLATVAGVIVGIIATIEVTKAENELKTCCCCSKP